MAASVARGRFVFRPAGPRLGVGGSGANAVSLPFSALAHVEKNVWFPAGHAPRRVVPVARSFLAVSGVDLPAECANFRSHRLRPTIGRSQRKHPRWEYTNPGTSEKPFTLGPFSCPCHPVFSHRTPLPGSTDPPFSLVTCVLMYKSLSFAALLLGGLAGCK